MAEDSCATRDQPFRDLLLSVSKQLSESDNVEGLRYLADLGHSPSCSALELLKAMRNKGMFSPHFCSPLAELLRKIERHDLADEVMNKYVAVFPDQASPTVTERGRNGRRRRSATDPLPPFSKSTSSNLDSVSSGPTSLTQGFVEGQISGDHQCGGSLEHATTTSQSGLDAHEQGATPQDCPHIPPSKTSMSLRSISQSSQISHSYPNSYSSSNSSSYNSLNSATEAVLDRASTMLFHHVTANLTISLPRGQEFTNTSSAVHFEPVAQTLPSRIAPLSLVHPEHPGALEAIRVSEIYSDQEEGGYEERRDTLECPAAIASRHKKARQRRLQPLLAANESDSLHPEQKDLELSRTPRASLLLQDDTGDLENNMMTQGVGKEADSTNQLPAPEGAAIGGPRQANKPGLTCKEKQWKKCLNIFGKHKTKRNSGNAITWRVPRDDLGKPIWNHDEKRCISRSHKFELDTNLGRHNPKLLFQLYPYGESSDCGEYVTMIVRINTSDKCPPLPPSATVQISLTVCDDNSDGERCVLNRIRAEEHLNLGYFAIRQVVQHGQLKKSRSKYIYFDLEINCSRLDWDSGLHNRRPTL